MASVFSGLRALFASSKGAATHAAQDKAGAAGPSAQHDRVSAALASGSSDEATSASFGGAAATMAALTGFLRPDETAAAAPETPDKGQSGMPADADAGTPPESDTGAATTDTVAQASTDTEFPQAPGTVEPAAAATSHTSRLGAREAGGSASPQTQRAAALADGSSVAPTGHTEGGAHAQDIAAPKADAQGGVIMPDAPDATEPGSGQAAAAGSSTAETATPQSEADDLPAPSERAQANPENETADEALPRPDDEGGSGADAAPPVEAPDQDDDTPEPQAGATLPPDDTTDPPSGDTDPADPATDDSADADDPSSTDDAGGPPDTASGATPDPDDAGGAPAAAPPPPPAASVPAPIVLLHFEDTGPVAADDSGNARDGAYQGGASPGATGWDGAGTAVSFDGEDDFVEIAADTAFALPEGTVAFRINAADLGGRQALVSRDSSGYDDGGHLTAWVHGDGRVEVRLQSDSASTTLESASGAITEGDWAHIAISFGPEGAALVIDGVTVDTDSYTGGIDGNNEPWTLGAGQNRSGDGVASNLKDYFEGAIDEFAVFDTQLDPDALLSLAEDGIASADDDGGPDTPATDPVAPETPEVPAPIVLLHFEDTGPVAADDSGNARDGAYQGGASPGATGWDGAGTAVSFDGEDDFVEIAADTAFALPEGTVAFRINAAELGGRQALVSRDSSGYDDGGHLTAWVHGDGRVEVRLQSDSASTTLESASGAVTEGDWAHIAISFGPEGAALVIDGVTVDTDAYTGGIDGNNEPWTLGAGQNRSGDGVASNLKDYFEGAIDEFAVFDTQLDPDALLSLAEDGIASADDAGDPSADSDPADTGACSWTDAADADAQQDGSQSQDADDQGQGWTDQVDADGGQGAGSDPMDTAAGGDGGASDCGADLDNPDQGSW